MTAAHFSNFNLTYSSESVKCFLFIRRKTRCSSLMFISLRFPAHASLHTENARYTLQQDQVSHSHNSQGRE